MKKKSLTFEELYVSDRYYEGDLRYDPIRKSRCAVLWSNSLQLVIVTEKGLFSSQRWRLIKTYAMASHDRSYALRQGMALVEVVEKSHVASRAGNIEESLMFTQQAEAFGHPERWGHALNDQGEQDASPPKDPPAPPTPAPAGLLN